MVKALFGLSRGNPFLHGVGCKIGRLAYVCACVTDSPRILLNAYQALEAVFKEGAKNPNTAVQVRRRLTGQAIQSIGYQFFQHGKVALEETAYMEAYGFTKHAYAYVRVRS